MIPAILSFLYVVYLYRTLNFSVEQEFDTGESPAFQRSSMKVGNRLEAIEARLAALTNHDEKVVQS